MKVHVWACTDGFLQQSEFQRQVWRWYMETWSDKVLPDVYLGTLPRPLSTNRWRLETKVQSQISPLFLIMSWPRDLSFCIRWHAGINSPFWNIHGALVLMKRCILVPRFFCWVGVEVALPSGRNFGDSWEWVSESNNTQNTDSPCIHALPFFPACNLTYLSLIQ